jgi:hypothetical protein
MFIPLAVGILCSAACAPLINKHYLKTCAKYNGKPPAEVRLIPMMFSCWFVPIGLFIFAWSSYPKLSYWSVYLISPPITPNLLTIIRGPALGGFPVGFGFLFLYNSANNYIIDSYQHQAASALAAKTFLRSMCGAGTVLFTSQLIRTCGYQWGVSTIAFIALACCGIPFVFYFYGARIRKHSKYAFSSDDEKATTGAEDVENQAK